MHKAMQSDLLEVSMETETVLVDLGTQAREILEKAQEKGVEHSFMFVTAFRRYQEHLAHLDDLERAIKENETMITKEYVKGRINIYVNPAIAAYNQTAGAADKTAQLLLKYIVAPLAGGGEAGDEFDVF
jgi:DNA-directed RNA polymerase beta' subunit